LTKNLSGEALPEGQLTLRKMVATGGTIGVREAWVADAIVHDALARVKQWKHPVTGQMESTVEYQQRMILNEAIKTSLKNFKNSIQTRSKETTT